MIMNIAIGTYVKRNDIVMQRSRGLRYLDVRLTSIIGMHIIYFIAGVDDVDFIMVKGGKFSPTQNQ